MSRKKAGTTKALSVTLTLSNYATLEELRWSHRMSFSDMLDEAVGVYIDQNGIPRVAVVEVGDQGILDFHLDHGDAGMDTEDAPVAEVKKPAK